MTINKRLFLLILLISFGLAQSWFGNLFKSEKSIAEISEIVSPSVVLIGNVDYNDEVVGGCSGFIVRKNGVVVTNFHVINGANKLIIKTKDNEIFEVTGIIDFDIDTDFAIIKISANNLPILEIGESENLEIGTKTIAIGNPHGLEHTVSDGIISQVRKVDNFSLIQTTTPITFGSSGGPLLNLYAEVIGITTAGFEGSGNIGFAIPIHQLSVLSKDYLPIKYS